MSFSFTELFSYFSGFLGFILAMVILALRKGKGNIRISLALVLIVGSIIVVQNALMYSGKILNFPSLMRVESPFHYLLGPVCFFYTLASFKPNLRFKLIHLVNLVPFFLNLIEFTPFYLSGNIAKVNYYNELMTTGSGVMPMHYLLKSLSAVLYLSLQLYVFYKYKTRMNVKLKPERHLINWFYIYLASQAVLTGGLMLDQLTGLNLFYDPLRYSTNMLTIFLFSISIALLFFPGLLYGNRLYENTSKTKYKYSKLTTSEKEAILARLITFLENTKKPYLNPKLSLAEVSKALNINPPQLSQVINEETSLNFNDYINTFRVKEAKSLLYSDEYLKLTIYAIAHKAGFNSKSPFYSAFKKHTGLTPKQFIQERKTK